MKTKQWAFIIRNNHAPNEGTAIACYGRHESSYIYDKTGHENPEEALEWTQGIPWRTLFCQLYYTFICIYLNCLEKWVSPCEISLTGASGFKIPLHESVFSVPFRSTCVDKREAP